MSETATAIVRKRSARPRERDDFYRTPSSVTEALLSVERFGPRVWEPACGDGALSRVLERSGYDVVSSDLIDRGYGTPDRDFLLERRREADDLVTNPPFRLADQFVAHALGLGCTKVALFARLAFLEGAARRQALWQPHPPARVWVFSKRQTLWRGDDPDPRDKGGVIAFAWFVWEAGHTGTMLGWLP